MNCGIVVHGPNIIDSGYALKLINLLKDYGDVEAILGGTMGRTAVIDNSLEKIIDISHKRFPSDSLKLFHDKKVDVIFLLNYGKSNVTGQVFGYKVYNNFKNKIVEDNIPVIQIERPGEVDGTIISWNGLNDDLANELSNKLNLKVVTPQEIYENHFKEDEKGELRRTIHGVSPGENILVNSIVIGKATGENLTLVSKNNVIVDIEGGIIKPHGVEKLGKVNLNSAIVKTGLLRKSNVTPRVLEKKFKSNKVAFLDHAGEDVYSYKDADIVVTIGDDTTLIASDILYRFNTPIIGITDGDLDKVVESGFKTQDSIIFEVESGYDDIIGCEIFKLIFENKKFIEIDKNQLKDEIINIINDFGCKYIVNEI